MSKYGMKFEHMIQGVECTIGVTRCVHFPEMPDEPGGWEIEFDVIDPVGIHISEEDQTEVEDTIISHYS